MNLGPPLALRRDYTEPALVGSVAAVALLGVWAEVRYAPSSAPSAVFAYALAAGAAATLPVRRRRPVAAAAGCLALCYVYRAAGFPGFAPAVLVFVLCYTLANLRGLVYGLVPALVAWLIPAIPPHTLSLVNAAVAMPPVGMAVAAVVGESNRRRRLDYEARVRESAATAEARLGRRMAEERLRIARELHDVLAHTISVVAVQSSVALDALGDSPHEARDALLAVRGAAKQAMPELRAALDMLRGGVSEDGAQGAGAAEGAGAEPKTVPQPGFDELPALIRQARESGLTVEFAVDEELSGASPLLQLTAYRIVQEALTNVRKHAAASARVRVTLHRSPDAMTIDVLDDGRAAAPAPAPSVPVSPVPAPSASAPSEPSTPGFGLLGMRERAESLGGRLLAGPSPDGGFAVRARLPWIGATS